MTGFAQYKISKTDTQCGMHFDAVEVTGLPWLLVQLSLYVASTAWSGDSFVRVYVRVDDGPSAPLEIAAAPQCISSAHRQLTSEHVYPVSQYCERKNARSRHIEYGYERGTWISGIRDRVG